MKIKKPSKIRLPKYLKWLRTQPCAMCGKKANEYLDIVPAHQRFDGGSVAQKTHDTFCIPLCTHCHNEEHLKGRITFWQGRDRAFICLRHLTLWLMDGK